MKIGLIIPYKNAKEWLPRCLKSIGSQQFEVYLVNDHSTDGGHVIAVGSGLSSDNIYPLWLDHDSHGVSWARNVGISEALQDNCDYITFLDADDELTPDAYNVITEAINFYPDADIIQLNHLREQPNGAMYNKFYNPRGERSLDNLPALWAVVWNKIYKSSLIKKLSFELSRKHGEDELFNLEALAKARKISCYEKIAVIHHCDNPKSLSKLTEANDLYLEQTSLLSFLLRNKEDKELCEAVRKRQLELWNNPVYKKVFGGA